MLIGGFFLYASYYGTDQSQVQRELSVGSINDVRKSLLVNAFGRFPLVLLYVVMGVLVGAVFTQPALLKPIAGVLQTDSNMLQNILSENPDRMVPLFILGYLPHGIIGFIFVAIMAALMSSLDSGLNSLSAVTMKDIYQKFIKPNAPERHYLRVSKTITIFWGVFAIGAALLMTEATQAARQTTIVLINAVGSMLYGPILAAFLLGMFSKKMSARGVKAGILSGIFVNILLWVFTSVSWMWWNVSGFLVAVLAALTVNSMNGRPIKISSRLQRTLSFEQPSKWRLVYGLVVLYFFLIMAVGWWLQG